MKANTPAKTKSAKLRTVIVDAGTVVQDDLFGEVDLISTASSGTAAAAESPPLRQIVLDTETTGIHPAEGDRVVEIGCVELVDRVLTGRSFHCYLNPDRRIDDDAVRVHGLTNGFLMDKPRFKDIAAEFLDFIKGAEIIAHNASFDTAFLNAELRRLSKNPGYTVEAWSSKITDTLKLARKLWPGKKNNLDALVKRYNITHHTRNLHGALLDAQILADVYILMSGAQFGIHLQGAGDDSAAETGIRRIERETLPAGPSGGLRVIRATPDELKAHEQMLAMMRKKLEGAPIVWDQAVVAPDSGSAPDPAPNPAPAPAQTQPPQLVKPATPVPDPVLEQTSDQASAPAAPARAFAFI